MQENRSSEHDDSSSPENSRSTGSGGCGPRFMRRSTSPAMSVASSMSEHSDFRPSSTGNRLLVNGGGMQSAQGFRPVHIPSLTSALSPHLLCPVCKKKQTLRVTIDEERSLGAAGVLSFMCSSCKEPTVHVPASPALAGKEKCAASRAESSRGARICSMLNASFPFGFARHTWPWLGSAGPAAGASVQGGDHTRARYCMWQPGV